MQRTTRLCLLLGLLALGACVKEEPPLLAPPPPPEDLSTWSTPSIVQHPAPPMVQAPPVEDHKPTMAEKLYDFAPGGTYQATVMVGFPLDLIFERGEEIRNYAGGDPELLEQGQQANRWEVKPGASGRDS